MNWNTLPLAIAVFTLAYSPVPGLALDAASVFKSVGPTVVMIRDLEGLGSGVVLSSDGLIVTCFHLANTPLKQTVIAEVHTMGKRSRQEFNDVKLVGVHPTHDLALIQVKAPAGVTFFAAPKPVGRAISTGEDCFVIGNPSGPSGKALDNSISKGIISAADRVIEEQHFIQVTAPINPGNSGGALCDKNGGWIGVVTFKMDQAEGLGFAIPISNLRQADFLPVKERKGNAERGTRYEEAGLRWHSIANRSEGADRDAATFLAFLSFRLSLMEMPNEPSPYHNVGSVYYELGEYESSQAYLERAVELNPDYPTSHQMLGMIGIFHKDPERAKKHFLAGMASRSPSPSQAQCADNYGVRMMVEKNYPEAAYAAKWAMVADDEPRRRSVRQGMLQDSSQHLSDQQVQEIFLKRGGFSIDDMKRFAAGKSVTIANTSEASSPEKIVASSVSPSMAKWFEKALEGAPKPAATGLRKALPEAPVEICPAMGGAYMVMHFKDMKKLGVLNIAQAKFDGYIPIDDDAPFAAGGTNLLVYLPRQRMFQVWNLLTLQMTSSKPCRILGDLTDLEMGPLQPQSALVCYTKSTEDLASRNYAILDLGTFQIVPIPERAISRFRFYRDKVHIRPNENFSAVTIWSTSQTPTGLLFARLSGLGVENPLYRNEDCGSLSIDRRGRKIYSTLGNIYSPETTSAKSYPGASLFAVGGGDFFLEVRKRQVVVRESPGEAEISRFEIPYEFTVADQDNDKLTDDRLIQASAQLNRACFVNLKNTVAYVFELGLLAGSRQIREPLDGVTRGTLWNRKMNFPAGTRVIIEDAPEGLKYEASDATLSWQIPSTQPAGNVLILLNVTLPGKDEVYQRVILKIQ